MVLYDSFYSLHHVILHERYIASRYCWIKWPVDPMVEKPQIAILINGLWALFQPNVGMESLPEDTEWTWVWTSHGQSLKAFCSTWRDTCTEHRVLLEPHQATDKENEWLPQRLSPLVPPGVHVQRKIQWRKLFLEFCWAYFTFLSCLEHFSYFESDKAIWVK